MVKYEFKSLNYGKTIITIDGGTLTIERPGIMSKMSLGFTGAKTVMINQISSVQIKEVGFARGYIQFILAGTKEARSGVIFGEANENIVYSDSYWGKKNKEINSNFRAIKKYIEDYNSKSNATVVQNIKTPIEQIKDLKELLDMGAITQDEYDKKKNELLNL